MDRTQSSKANLKNIHNKCVADILTRYRELVMLSTMLASEDSEASPQAVAVARLSMKQEFDGLYTSIKELLALSRRMKELWTFGPLGKEDPDHRAKEEQLDGDVRQAYGILCDIEKMNLQGLAGKYGGTWEAGSTEEPTTAAAATATATATAASGATGDAA